MGRHAASGRIRLDATLGDLGIDDVQPLTDIEKTARVRDLLCSRSGVYSPAGSAGGDVPLRRGARRPGEQFAYNNWDFNVLETIFENATSLSVHEAFEQDLTGPLGLTDHAPSSHRVLGDPSRSRHLAHHFFLSARELMSIGQLVLNHGVAAGCRIVPPEWLTQVLTPHVDAEDIGISPFGSVSAAYGYLWWLPRMDGDPRWSGAAVAAGNYGQYVLILPRISTVIVHRRFVSREFAVGRKTDVRMFLARRGRTVCEVPISSDSRGSPWIPWCEPPRGVDSTAGLHIPSEAVSPDQAARYVALAGGNLAELLPAPESGAACSTGSGRLSVKVLFPGSQHLDALPLIVTHG